MLKIIAIGIWVSIATLGSFYGVMVWQSGKSAAVEQGDYFGKLEKVRTNIVSVPIISKGKISGYVLVDFIFLADANALKQMTVPAKLIVADEAFRAIYVGSLRDFERLERYDLAGLTKKMQDGANKRFGAKVIRDVLIDSINYVPKSQLRAGARRKK